MNDIHAAILQAYISSLLNVPRHFFLVMRDKHDSLVLIECTLKVLARALEMSGEHALEGFVEDEEGRLAHECACEQQTAFLALRELCVRCFRVDIRSKLFKKMMYALYFFRIARLSIAKHA